MRLKFKSFNQTASLLGIVLCGGKSSRMGFDKGLIKKDDKTYSEHCATFLEKFTRKVIISINEAQYSKYQFLLEKYDFIADSIKLRGPLAGLLSVHLVYPRNPLLAIACDMIDIKPELLERLLNTYTNKGDYDFYIFRAKDNMEPLLGIYKPEGLRKILNQLFMGELKDNSLYTAIYNGDTLFLDLTEDDLKIFNTTNLV